MSQPNPFLAEHHHRVAAEYLAVLASCYPVEMGTAWSGRAVRRAQRHLLALAGDVDARLVEKASRRSHANEPARWRGWREGAAGHAVELQPRHRGRLVTGDGHLSGLAKQGPNRQG